MQILNQDISKTKAKYSITADDNDLNAYREAVASRLTSTVKVPGFRPGKAPADMILKYADQANLQDEFLNLAINSLYLESQKELNVKIVGEPKISVVKFVPFSTLEISVEVPIIKDLKLPDYKKLNLTKAKQKVTKELIDKNLSELQKRAATLQVVKRAAKKGDLVVTDFDATDPKTKKKLEPASAKDYRVRLGEGTLIPGFEDQLIGLAAGKTKTFDLTFPKDYGDKSFAGRKVHFKASVSEVNSVDLPKLDDELAKTVGPFNTLEELNTELKKQLESENERQATIDLENRMLNKIADNTTVEIDETLVDAEREFLLNNAKQNAIGRGQTWKEFLQSTGQSEDHYLSELTKVSTTRIKGGLAIGEIAQRQGLTINDTEIETEIVNLKTRYTDPEMLAQLESPDNRNELRMRLLTEKVLDFLVNNQIKSK